MKPPIKEPIAPSKEATKTTGTTLTVIGDDDVKCEPLTGAELKQLSDLEDIIQHGLANFIQTGEALAEIQRYRLYLNDYQTIDEYLRGRWGLGKSHGYRLISAAKVSKVLAGEATVQPTHESQVRPLISLESDQVPKVWKVAIEIADGNPITEEIVKKAVREVVGKKESNPKARKLSWKAVAKQAGFLLARTRIVSIILKQNHSVVEAMELMGRIQPFLESLAKANNGK